MWQEREGRVWDHKLNYSKHDWAIVWCDGLVIHSWGSPNCSFMFFYSPLLKPEGLGKWLTDTTTRQTHCRPFPLNLGPIHLFSPLSLWCKCTGLLGKLVWSQKIGWNNTVGCNVYAKIKRCVSASALMQNFNIGTFMWDIYTGKLFFVVVVCWGGVTYKFANVSQQLQFKRRF